MGETEEKKIKYIWKDLLKKEWKALAVVIVAGIIACIGFVLVFFSVIQTSTLGGKGTWTFDRWTLTYVIGFFIISTGWVLLVVGAPAAVFFGVFGYLWWKNLSDETKEECRALDKSEKQKRINNRAYQGGGGSFFTFIVVCIMVALDGNWNTQFGALDYSYFIYALFFGLMWIGIIIGIPVCIAVLIWYLVKKK